MVEGRDRQPAASAKGPQERKVLSAGHVLAKEP